jgi:hypothetical protein
VKVRYLGEWVTAMNAHGGFGIWHAATTHYWAETRDILMLLSGDAASQESGQKEGVGHQLTKSTYMASSS